MSLKTFKNAIIFSTAIGVSGCSNIGKSTEGQEGKTTEIETISNTNNTISGILETQNIPKISLTDILLNLDQLSESSNITQYYRAYNIIFDYYQVTAENFEQKLSIFNEKYLGGSDASGEIIDITGYKVKLSEFIIKDYIKEEINILTQKFEEISFNEYTSIAYLLYEKDSVDKLFQDLTTELNDMNLSENSIENTLDIISSKIKLYSETKDSMIKSTADVIRIFETYPEVFNLEIEDDIIFTQALSEGLKFRLVDRELYSYTTDGIFISSIEIGSKNIASYTQKLIDRYGNVKISDYLEKLVVDQEDKVTPYYVEDISFLEDFKIPKEYAEILESMEKNGYIFKIINYSNGNINLLVLENEKVIMNITTSNRNNTNKVDLWLDVLVINFLDTHTNKEDTINIPEANILELNQNKISFINDVYKLVFSDDNFTLLKGLKITDFSIDTIIAVGFENGLPLDIILGQIPFILDKINNKVSHLYDIILNNLDSYLPKKISFLNKYNMSEEKYFTVKAQYDNMYNSIFNRIILNHPENSLKKITKLANSYTSKEIFINTNFIGDKRGIHSTILYIIQKVLSVNPSLYNDDIIQEYNNQYGELDRLISHGIENKIENQETIGEMSGGSFSDFDNSSRFVSTQKIRYDISDEWFDGFKLTDTEIRGMKLSIARNLSMQYQDNMSELDYDFKVKGKKMVLDNLRLILENRDNLHEIEIFGSFDIFHIAHYGQDLGFDAMGTELTQKALRYQAGNKKYSLFDAESIYHLNLLEGNNQLEKYYNKFIINSQPAMLLTEGHGSSNSFSVLQKHKTRDKLGINSAGFESIGISPAKLVDIIIKRQKIKDEKGIIEPDKILFAACKGDYAINFYSILNNHLYELGENFIPPIMMTAAESGQNSQFSVQNLDTEIPYLMLRYTLDIGNKEKTTFGTFFKNHSYDPKVGSDPSLFYPVFINGKWIPQQLG